MIFELIFRMNNITCSLILSILISLHLYADDKKYDTALIPQSMLPADAVVRYHSVQFTIKDTRRSVQKVNLAITIFSKNEQDKGELVLFYNKFNSIDDLEGTIFDSEGNEIRELNDEDIKDYSAVDNYTLHDDSRVKYATLYHNRYPYTIEYSYEIQFNGSIHWPDWYAQRDENPVEQTMFEIVAPKNYILRYWSNRDSIKPETVTEKNQTIYRWQQKNLPKLSKETIDGDMYDATVIVKIAPGSFQIEDTEGSMNTWKEFGLWYYRLKKDKWLLPENALADIKFISASGTSRRETIKKLYEYMQSKTRYVSLQLGIGGWEPFDAMYVHTRGYGDCKALTNYMEAMLRQAGITSYPVLINSGTDRFPMVTEFPSNQFNHVILCVPDEKDTIWLECTSQSRPFGRLRYSTENRSALLITADGGIVVKMPGSTSEQNLQRRSANVTITSGGTAVAIISTTLSGNKQTDTQVELIDASPKEREDWILEQMTMSNIVLSSFTIVGVESRSPEISFDVSASFPRYASVNGNRIFFHPSLIARRTVIPPFVTNRLSPIRFNYPYKNIDTIFFSIPKEFIAETLPVEIHLHTSFGSFNGKTISVGDSAIVYTRVTEIQNDLIPAAQYSEYRNFISEIVKADRAQVVLKKNLP